jgi:acyl transferase domain-containing protein
MSLNGSGVVAIWHDLLPQAKDEFYEWHNREHMPERLGIPGFRRGRRYIALQGMPEYFNLYEADSPAVLSGPDYLQRLNAPTPWTRQVVASFRNVSRALCRVVYSGGVGQGAVMLTLRFDVAAPAHAEVEHRLCRAALPAVVDARGVAGVHLCRADEQASAIETAEKKARASATLIPRWILLIEGISARAVEDGAKQVAAALAGQPAVRDLDQAVYLLQHQRCKMPWGDPSTA